MHVCHYNGSRVHGSQCALLECGLVCSWTLDVAFEKFVMLAACFVFVATDRGPLGPSGGSLIQFIDALLAAMLAAGFVYIGPDYLRQTHMLQNSVMKTQRELS